MLSRKYMKACHAKKRMFYSGKKKREHTRNRFVAAHNRAQVCRTLAAALSSTSSWSGDCVYTNVRHSIGFNQTNNSTISGMAVTAAAAQAFVVAKYAYSSVQWVYLYKYHFYDWFNGVKPGYVLAQCTYPLNINTFIAGRNWLYYTIKSSI